MGGHTADRRIVVWRLIGVLRRPSACFSRSAFVWFLGFAFLNLLPCIYLSLYLCFII